MEKDIILKLENIVKIFPGVKALDNVKLEIRKGEVHALCGENGAGKSTLMKIISGAQKYTHGKMYYQGKEVEFSTTKQAEEMGISMIYQEFNLVQYLSIGENLFLGRQPVKRTGVINWNKLFEDSKEILKKVGLEIDPRKMIKDISVAEMQMVEIAKCLSINSKVIIMDEPTAALSEEEIKKLFEIIKNLTKDEISIIYISHRMEEIFKVTDRITIFRDGKYVKTMNTDETDNNELVSLMVGKDILDFYPNRNFKGDEIALEVKDLSVSKIKNVSFKLYKGEILGIYGLLGAGSIELSKAIFGYYNNYIGDIIINNKKVNIKNPLDAIMKGVSLVPDDRKNEGIILGRSVKENISLPSLNTLENNKILNLKEEKIMVEREVSKLNIKIASIEQLVENLSGGNQQKVVFAKMLETKPNILILDEPTRGVDVGSKAEIYHVMDELTKQDISVILVSSDLPELIGMSDRVIIMREGRIVKELKKHEANQKTVLAHAAGGVQQ